MITSRCLQLNKLVRSVVSLQLPYGWHRGRQFHKVFASLPNFNYAKRLHSNLAMNMDNSLTVPPPLSLRRPMEVPGGSEGRLLLGPGPANISQRVREALSKPILGHLHPEFVKIMDDAKAGLRYLFQTEEAPIVCCFSGTGHMGMEGLIFNLLEGDERLLVVDVGIWGQRAQNMAMRQGLDVKVLKGTPGSVITPESLDKAMEEHKPSMVLLVHCESSTGVLQPLEGMGDICRKHNALLCVDTVASVGGVPFLMDKWKVDAVYTGTQKVLGAPPGLSPCALGQRAKAKLESRKTPVRSFYMDLTELGNYWGCDDSLRRYHHTGPISSIYALREALADLSSEGLVDCWARHKHSVLRLHKGLEEMGLSLYVEDPSIRAPTVTTIKVPDGVDWKVVSTTLMNKHQIEVSGGLGPTAGKVWRIGLMGGNSTAYNVDTVLRALGEAIAIVRGSKL